MTKSEILSELKAQDQFFKVLDRPFDLGWREWVLYIHRQNDISNLRMFKILAAIKSVDFVDDVISFMKAIKRESSLIRLTRKPRGIIFKDNRYQSIPELMIEKHHSGSYTDLTIYIQITKDRWIVIHH